MKGGRGSRRNGKAYFGKDVGCADEWCSMAQGLENGTLQVQSQSDMVEAREPAWKESEQDPESLGGGSSSITP